MPLGGHLALSREILSPLVGEALVKARDAAKLPIKERISSTLHHNKELSSLTCGVKVEKPWHKRQTA